MGRLKGGELLLDLTSLGNVSDNPTLTDEQFNIIKKLCGWKNNTFIDIPKPIMAKCNVANNICHCVFNVLYDDKSSISGSVFCLNTLYEIVIDSTDGAISVNSHALS